MQTSALVFRRPPVGAVVGSRSCFFGYVPHEGCRSSAKCCLLSFSLLRSRVSFCGFQLLQTALSDVLRWSPEHCYLVRCGSGEGSEVDIRGLGNVWYGIGVKRG